MFLKMIKNISHQWVLAGNIKQRYKNLNVLVKFNPKINR